MLFPILWYLIISIVGWLTFPLAFRLLPALADHGYAFTRILGLLVWGFLFWLLGSLGLLRNDVGGLLFALLLLIALSGWALRGISLDELGDWLRSQRELIIAVEIIFLLAFVWMGVVRSANPEINGTEKPMELAFINAIMHSDTLPPHDPWLSGFAISYYYFGYVLVAMLAKLAGTPGSVAFNLGIILVFALTAVGAYGVVYNLLAARLQTGRNQTRSVALAMLAPVFVLLVGNLGGFLEVLHARGVGWSADPNGQLSSPFWEWIDLQELSEPPQEPFTLTPTRYLWWWRASRVLQDYDYAGNFKEAIDEFPAFSYLLGDLHPHVLAMPFAFLAMGLALNLFLGGSEGNLHRLRRKFSYRTLARLAAVLFLGGIAALAMGLGEPRLSWLVIGFLSVLAGVLLFVAIPPVVRLEGLRLFSIPNLGEKEFGLALNIAPASFLLAAVSLGGLSFLNTWDFPFYVALFSGAYMLRQVKNNGLGWGAGLKDFFRLGFALGIAGICLYLPFYLGFSSQAGGILPSMVYFTRGVHIWVMFAPLLLPLFVYVFISWRRGSGGWRRQGFLLAGGLVAGLWMLSFLLAIAISLVPQVSGFFLSNLAAPSLGELIGASLVRRLAAPGGWLTLLLLLMGTLGLIIKWVGASMGEKGALELKSQVPPSSPLSPSLFTLLLILLGTLLVLGPEFFYLRDLFGYRINTIFKFYFQAWLLWGVAAAYASIVLLQELRRWKWAVFSLTWAAVVGMGLTYTVLGLATKTNNFNPPFGFTLDGTAHLIDQAPNEMSAASWLRHAPPGVVAEAIGGSYSIYGRVSTLSGQPAVLGWDFHEVQWRGGSEALGTRQEDIARLYCSRDWEEAQEVIQRYNIRYIVVGNLERGAYTPQTCSGGLNDAKFLRNLPVAYQSGEVTIYLAP